MIFGKGKEFVSSSANFVVNYWTSKSHVPGLRTAPKTLGTQVAWQPPAWEYIKINVDASFVEDISAASVGVVARDSYGNVIISSWDFIGLCKSAEEAELRACIAGLYIGITLHNPEILETECAFVVASLAKDNFDRSALFDLKKEAMNISKMLNGFKISKINRSANVVAHLIAKYSLDNR